ncbi:MAG: biliverdin-producing heme oxygenase [Campylobacteraceae bacterium]|nr:biliverdin-producing heme oxygenase [Campylobacteraceae bacterium]
MLSDLLKSQTQTLHDKLEKNPFMQKIEKEKLTKEDYIILLELFFKLHHCLETQMIEFEELNMAMRERKSHLVKDLSKLNYDVHKAHKNFGADLEIKIDTLSKAYGALYVLEGSRMGGLFLSQLIRAQLGEEIPLSYFEGFKEQTLTYVSNFKAILNEKSSILNEQECVQSAKDIFIFVDYLFGDAKRIISS